MSDNKDFYLYAQEPIDALLKEISAGINQEVEKQVRQSVCECMEDATDEMKETIMGSLQGCTEQLSKNTENISQKVDALTQKAGRNRKELEQQLIDLETQFKKMSSTLAAVETTLAYIQLPWYKKLVIWCKNLGKDGK